MRRFVFASHHTMACGIKDTLDFLTNGLKHTYDLNCYLDDDEESVEEKIETLFSRFDREDEVLVFTDMFGGSVSQKFFSYINSYGNIYVICGMNLPLAMSLVMMPENILLNEKEINLAIDECKKQIVLMNGMNITNSPDDE